MCLSRHNNHCLFKAWLHGHTKSPKNLIKVIVLTKVHYYYYQYAYPYYHYPDNKDIILIYSYYCIALIVAQSAYQKNELGNYFMQGKLKYYKGCKLHTFNTSVKI